MVQGHHGRNPQSLIAGPEKPQGLKALRYIGRSRLVGQGLQAVSMKALRDIGRTRLVGQGLQALPMKALRDIGRTRLVGQGLQALPSYGICQTRYAARTVPTIAPP